MGVVSPRTERTVRVVILTSLFWLTVNLLILNLTNDGPGSNIKSGQETNLGEGGNPRYDDDPEDVDDTEPIRPVREVVAEERKKRKEIATPKIVATGRRFKEREEQNEPEPLEPQAALGDQIDPVKEESKDPAGVFQRSYPESQLRRWSPPKFVERSDSHPGSLGAAAHPPDKEEAKRRFKEHQFNIVASDMVPLDRSLKDIRTKQCQTQTLPAKLPSTSVIIVFHNEAWSTLLRTVHSVINRTPRELLDEILLVDDASELQHLGKELEDYVAKLEVPVKVLRMASRAGLVKARLLGAAEAVAPTLTFLDAHCECTSGWLETQLAQMATDRTVVPCPVIDSIDHDTFAYPGSSGGRSVGIFDWSFGFHWGTSPAQGDANKPRASPAMAGGLFTIDKEFFYHVGSYDENMEFWGGENIEMSLRIWRCGGSITIDPCSHVGHVFRSETPHQWPGGAKERGRMISRNTVRTVEVWADEWKELYYKAHPGMRDMDFGDVSDRLALKDKLQCKSMQWYLENVFPFSYFTQDYKFIGEIKHEGSGLCLDTLGKSSNVPGLYSCHRQGGSQAWMLTGDGRLRNNEHCISWHQSSEAGDVELKKVKCVGNDDHGARFQKWNFSEDGRLKGQGQEVCLGGPATKPHGVQTDLKLSKCNGRSDKSQVFTMQ